MEYTAASYEPQKHEPSYNSPAMVTPTRSVKLTKPWLNHNTFVPVIKFSTKLKLSACMRLSTQNSTINNSTKIVWLYMYDPLYWRIEMRGRVERLSPLSEERFDPAVSSVGWTIIGSPSCPSSSPSSSSCSCSHTDRADTHVTECRLDNLPWLVYCIEKFYDPGLRVNIRNHGRQDTLV